MELMFRGVKPYPLGSIMDVVSREYLQKTRGVEIRKTLLSVLSGVGAEPRDIASRYQEYLYESLDYGELLAQEERDLQAEYEKIRMDRPVISVRESDGQLVVKGLQ